MSYFSQLKRGQISIKEALAKSGQWLAQRAGRVLTDEDVDAIVKRADEVTDTLEPVLAGLIVAAFPALPPGTVAVIAARAAEAALDNIDTAISAAGAMIREQN